MCLNALLTGSNVAQRWSPEDSDRRRCKAKKRMLVDRNAVSVLTHEVNTLVLMALIE